MLRLLIGCLAVVGLITLLIVGGCVGLIAFGVKKGLEVPERARHERIEAAHATLLSDLRQRLGRPDGLAGMRPDRALVAIRVRSGGADDKDVDLLSLRPLDWRWNILVNGAGTAGVGIGGREIACLVYVLNERGQEYWIYLADPGPSTAVEKA